MSHIKFLITLDKYINEIFSEIVYKFVYCFSSDLVNEVSQYIK